MHVKLFVFIAICFYSCNNTKSIKTEGNAPKKEIFWSYYELCNTARDSFSSGNYSAASQLFAKAINFVKNPFWLDLGKAIETELILKNTTKAKEYSLILAEKYAIFPSEKYFKGVPQIDYNDFIEELKLIVEQTKQNFNQEYIALIDSLRNIDQGIRANGGIPNYGGPINIDSLNTHCLLGLIDRFGFPSAHKVGIKHYYFADLIFTHADFDFDNILLGDLLYKAVEQGDYKPCDYAEISDRRCNFYPLKAKPSVYFEIPIGYEELSETEKQEVTQRRKKIGLRSVESSLVIEILPSGDVRITPVN